MSKVIPNIKVRDLPFVKSLIEVPREERIRLGLIHSRGGVNEYRRAFLVGQGASTRDKTWSEGKHWHVCCKSKVGWRHKTNCKNALRNAPDDLSDIKIN